MIYDLNKAKELKKNESIPAIVDRSAPVEPIPASEARKTSEQYWVKTGTLINSMLVNKVFKGIQSAMNRGVFFYVVSKNELQEEHKRFLQSLGYQIDDKSSKDTYKIFW